MIRAALAFLFRRRSKPKVRVEFDVFNLSGMRAVQIRSDVFIGSSDNDDR